MDVRTSFAVFLVVVCVAACATTSTTSSGTGKNGRPCAFPELNLRLPFEETTERMVKQGNGGAFSHRGRAEFAWDFDLPEGTPVLAAADGVVAEAVDLYHDGGPDPALEERDNFVTLDHGGALFSHYGHLAPGGVLVHDGEHVHRGQVIGRSGNTGYTSGPHLHFAVIDYRNRSVPVCFVDVDGGVPIEGMSYRPSPTLDEGRTRKNPAAAPVPSSMPLDAFADNGIHLIANLPARLFKGGERVDAVALRPAKHALAVFWTRDHARQRLIDSTVTGDGRFSLVIPTEVLAELGPQLDFVIVLVRPDGSWASDFSIPIHYGAASGAGTASPSRQ